MNKDISNKNLIIEENLTEKKDGIHGADNMRIRYITIAQIIAMGFIVLCHSNPATMDVSNFFENIAFFSIYIALPVFMFTSGFILVKADSIGKYGYCIYVKRRFMRLMIPFFVVQLILLLPKYLIQISVGADSRLNIAEIARSFAFPREGILPHLWFLPALMIFSLISPLLIKTIKSKMGAFVLIAFSLGISFLPNTTDLLGINDLKLYLFWYVLGIVGAFHFSSKIKFNFYILNISWILYLFIVILFEKNVVTLFFTSFCALIFVVELSKYLENKAGAFYRYFSNKTFPIYILSLPVQNLVEVVGRKAALSWELTAIAMFVIGIVVPLVIVKIVLLINTRAKNKILSRIIGL